MEKDVDIELQTIKLQNKKLYRRVEEIQKILETQKNQNAFDKEYFTIEDCAQIKGGAALNTFKCNRFLLPGCGNPRFNHYVAGRLCFARADVLRWVKINDADYPEYAKECGVTIVPEKYMRLAAKAKGVSVCNC